jgi:predicted RNA-binding Zn-ribbon protein involved in translation (DUF1610 family)
MKINFPCPGCRKKLKARPDSAGRTRKCPVCATRVTCPEPVAEARFIDADLVDAEVVEAELVPAARKAPAATRRAAGADGGGVGGAGYRTGTGFAPPAPNPAPGFNPFADLDDDDPYQLASPGPVETSTSEPQKPCPMCGEMILASAVKCRYCGEVLDPKLKKGKSKKRRKSSSGGRGLIVSVGAGGSANIGLGLLLIVAGLGLTAFSYSSAASKGGGNYFIYHGLVICGVVQLFRGLSGGSD